MLQDTLASLQAVSSPVPHTVSSGLAAMFPDAKGNTRHKEPFLPNMLTAPPHLKTLIPHALEVPSVLGITSSEITQSTETHLASPRVTKPVFPSLQIQTATEEEATSLSYTTLKTHRVFLLDLATAQHSLQALRALESIVTSLPALLEGLDPPQASVMPSDKPQKSAMLDTVLHLQLGHLVLTRAVLQKMAQIAQEATLPITMIYALVPQTQQAALQEGFAVKEKPLRPDDRLIQWAEPEAPSHAITPAITPTESLHTEALGTVHADATSLEHTKEHTNASASRTTDVPQTTVTIDPLSPEGFVVPELRLPRVNPEKLLPTLMLKQTLRSGQSVSYPGHVVIMGDVNAGAEIVAKGDVIVWGVLKGMVHAGHEGDRECLIRAHRIDALQIRIADILARRTQKGYALQASQTSLGQDATTQGAFLTQVAEVQEQEIKIRISRI